VTPLKHDHSLGYFTEHDLDSLAQDALDAPSYVVWDEDESRRVLAGGWTIDTLGEYHEHVPVDVGLNGFHHGACRRARRRFAPLRRSRGDRRHSISDPELGSRARGQQE
jgi:hypothetical protein